MVWSCRVDQQWLPAHAALTFAAPAQQSVPECEPAGPPEPGAAGCSGLPWPALRPRSAPQHAWHAPSAALKLRPCVTHLPAGQSLVFL